MAAIQFDVVDRTLLDQDAYAPRLGIIEVHFHSGGMETFHRVTEVEDLHDPPRLRFLVALASSEQVKVPYIVPLDGVRYYAIR